MKKELKQLLESYMKTEGVSLRSAIRDAMTDLYHLADKNKLNLEEIIEGATEVFEEEKAIRRKNR